MHGTSNSLAVLAARIREEHDAAEAAKGAAVVAARKGIEHAFAAGSLLLEAKAQVPHGQWLRWLAENCPTVSPRMAQYYMDLARKRPELESKCETVSHLTLREAVQLLEDGDEDEDESGSRGTSDEWFTPAPVLAVARDVLGHFDLDPASCPEAQRNVQATKYFTKEDDGLAQEWEGRIWLNPPYSQPLLDRFVTKLVEEVESQRVSEAILLMANKPIITWYKALRACSAQCLWNGRIMFEHLSGSTQSAQYGSAVFYFGDRVEEFARRFAQFGQVVRPDRGPTHNDEADDDDETFRDEDSDGDGPTLDPEPDRPRHHYHGGLAAEPFYKILQGDVRKLIADLPEVHCVITSPPYYNKITYGDSDRELGHEQSVEAYIAGLIAIFKAIPLHPLGSIWVNIGDKRNGDGGLLNVPGRFCSAMQANGFLLIDSAVWAKSVATVDGTTIGRVRIEPTLGRLNNSGYEMFFRFTKGQNAWSDTFAVQATRCNVEPQRYLPEDLMKTVTALNGRRLANVWLVSRRNIHESHYGCFPPELIERPVAMTCPPFVNPDGNLPRRLVDMVEYDDGIGRRTFGIGESGSALPHNTGVPYIPRMPVHRGWEEIAADASPGVVLDPFAGTGTTGEVALKLGRSFIGIELYENYAETVRKRCAAARDHVLRNYGYDRVYKMILEGDGGGDGGEEREKLIFFKSYLLSQAISGWALEDDTISEGVG